MAPAGHEVTAEEWGEKVVVLRDVVRTQSWSLKTADMKKRQRRGKLVGGENTFGR
jgi:hypothetical protein